MFTLLNAVFAIFFISWFYKYLARNLDYWKHKNVTTHPSSIFVGSYKDYILRRSDIGTMLKDFYNMYPNEKVVGLFRSSQPELMIRDLDLVRDVMIKDFSSFPNRLKVMNAENEPLDYNLLSLNGELWKPVRSKINPAFSSARLKAMFPFIVQKGKEMQEFMEDRVMTGKREYDARDLMLSYMSNVLASVGFGLDNPMHKESEFKKKGREVMHCGIKKSLKLYVRIISPYLYKLLGLNFYGKSVENYFMSLVKGVIEAREASSYVRNDFINILMNLRKENLFSDDVLASQAFSFVVAGEDATATTCALVLYELAKSPEVQKKVIQEIDDVIKMHNNELTYEAIGDMKYLDMTLMETLRKHPVAGALTRITVKDYTFSDIGVTIPKNTSVMIPIMGFHNDPQYFPEPEEFRPERFTKEENSKRHPLAFLPFGEGPRGCIG